MNKVEPKDQRKNSTNQDSFSVMKLHSFPSLKQKTQFTKSASTTNSSTPKSASEKTTQRNQAAWDLDFVRYSKIQTAPPRPLTNLSSLGPRNLGQLRSEPVHRGSSRSPRRTSVSRYFNEPVLYREERSDSDQYYSKVWGRSLSTKPRMSRLSAKKPEQPLLPEPTITSFNTRAKRNPPRRKSPCSATHPHGRYRPFSKIEDSLRVDLTQYGYGLHDNDSEDNGLPKGHMYSKSRLPAIGKNNEW